MLSLERSLSQRSRKGIFYKPMRNDLKTVTAILSAAFAISLAATAQEQKECSKKKIYVKVAIIDTTVTALQYSYPFKTAELWLHDFMDFAVKVVKETAGDAIEVIPWEERIFRDDDPSTPEEENAFIKPVPGNYDVKVIVGLYSIDEKTGEKEYNATVNLADKDIDGYGLGSFNWHRPDVLIAIRSALFRMSERGFGEKVEEYERTHFNALRDPKMKLKILDPGFVSPLPEEQKVNVEVATKDCREMFGEGTNLFYPREADRGTIKDVKSSEAFHWGDSWRVKTEKDGKIEFEYALKRGDDATRIAIDVKQVGRAQKEIHEVIFIPVKTLRVEVEPEKKRVAPGDETRVFVRLFKVDGQGTKEAVKGRTLDLKVTGLEDGRLEPRDKVTIDEDGVGTLTYTGGARDKTVTIEASYKPENYETTFKGEGQLNAGAYTITFDLEMSQRYVADGGMYISALGAHAVFEGVFFHEGLTRNILMAVLPIARGKGEFTKFLLHDIEPNKVGSGTAARESPRFTKGPPKSFTTQLKMAVTPEDMERRFGARGKPPASKTPPPPLKTAKLIFEYLGLMETEWQSSVGSATFDGLHLEFDAPWPDLLAGKPVTLKIPYEDGVEKGTWTITFSPQSTRK